MYVNMYVCIDVCLGSTEDITTTGIYHYWIQSCDTYLTTTTPLQGSDTIHTH